MLRNTINEAVKTAMKAKNPLELSTTRMINAAIKDKDIEARTKGNKDGITDAEILGLLQTMIKQRRESAKTYREGGRDELAEKEDNEIKIIEAFLPKQLSDDVLKAKIAEAIATTKAASMADMGKVMAVLKDQYPGQLDMGKASGLVKAALG